MWSELFFQNFKEALSNLFYSRYSLKEIEYTLYEELKSSEYEPFIT